MIYLFTDQGATQQEVGGKGYSLIKMTGGGFPVPAGMVLSVQFFGEWIDALMKMEELRLNVSDSDKKLRSKTLELQKCAKEFELGERQKAVLNEKLKQLNQPGNRMYSVRSSSPEEDMQGASFAGMYETYLGVTIDQIEKRIRDVFISCIDFRVVAYKRQKGFDFTRYSIAVVVMVQIKSDVAGVAFSLNPLNNCYDEVVINANFGLGESVVSGETVPDQFVVDAYNRDILSKKIGDKGVAVTLDESGGTATVAKETSAHAALSDEQILELSDMVKNVEAYYGMPMDTEWAYENENLYMLQARPITGYIPLHPVFQTEPGEPKKLYLDMTLIEQGFQMPLSVMGTDCFRELTDAMGVSAASIHVARKPGDFLYGAGGRAYINLSTEVRMEGQDKTAGEYEGLDTYAAQVIRDADMTPYRAHYTAGGILQGIKAFFVAGFKSHDTIGGILKGKKHPDHLREYIDKKGVEFLEVIDQLDKEPLSFKIFSYQALRKQADLMIHVTIPSLIDAESAKNSIKKLLKEGYGDTLVDEVDKIDRGLPYNITMEMSRRIYDLMRMLDNNELQSVEELKEKILKRKMPETFMARWDDFMQRFGFRGPREVDVKTPRYQDAPEIVIQQMKSYSALSEEESPRMIMERQAAERERAYGALLKKVNAKDGNKLKKHYEVLVNLGGYREIHKYFMVYVGEKIRYKALDIAGNFMHSGRMDAIDDIFSLTVDEVQRAIDDESLDVRQIVRHHQKYMSIAEKVDNYPPVIDSRGKILRPKRKKAKPGEIIGDPVSAGKVSGRVVIINYVGEKDIKKGDILVAKAADPGWTPLFINASGILLEVGGMLQHGSLIAREYGKPCIAGIQKVTELLKDGEIVEMDGSNGVVKKATSYHLISTKKENKMKQEIMQDVTIAPQIIDTKPGKVEIDITDKDAPVLLGCHGGVGGVDQSRLLIQFAEEDYRLLSVSRPGYLGTPIESGRTPEEQADLFAATLDALKIDKVAVISASFGGPFGYVFAYRHPDRIWALVACDAVSGHYDIPETAGPITQAIFLSDIGQSLLQSLTKLKPDAFVKKFFQTEAYFTKDQLKKHIDFVQNDAYIKEWIIAFMNAMYPYKPRKIGTENDMDIVVRLKGHFPVEKITCPTLIVHGTHDSDAKFYDGVYAYEHIPGAERIWIEEGSHICFWVNEKSKDAQNQVLDFLRKHQP